MNEQKRFVAYLGITQEGKILPHLVEGELSPLGTRFERGANQFPGSVYLVYEKGRNPTGVEFIQCLEDLQKFADKHLNQPQKKKK